MCRVMAMQSNAYLGVLESSCGVIELYMSTKCMPQGDLRDSAAIQHSVLLRSSCAREAATKLCFIAVA